MSCVVKEGKRIIVKAKTERKEGGRKRRVKHSVCEVNFKRLREKSGPF